MGPGMGHCRDPGTPASGPRRGRIARIRRSAWAANEIPGYLSPAPSDPLLWLWVRAVRTPTQRPACRQGSQRTCCFLGVLRLFKRAVLLSSGQTYTLPDDTEWVVTG